MEEMRKLAYFTVAKGSGFGLLAIFCTMVGFSFSPVGAMQSGGLLSLLMAVILLLKARAALTSDHRRTEMWLLLPKDFRPPEAYAQWASATVLRDAYLTFATWSALLAVLLLALSLLFRVAGFR